MRVATCLTLVLLAGVRAAVAADTPALVRARDLYNAASYDAAIAAASEARRQRGTADAAALVLARAHLERFRTTADASDLSSAREALQGITRSRLTPREQVELLVAIGQSLFLADDFGAAAEIFESAVFESTASESAVVSTAGRRGPTLPPHARMLLLDWWATALDREAQTRPPDRRSRVFDRMVGRMEQEIREDPASISANYWLAAAVRGTGDLDRAWDAAVAAWVRTSLDRESAATVRADLDRLVTQALVPERARQRPPREQAQFAAALLSEWDGIKRDWP